MDFRNHTAGKNRAVIQLAFWTASIYAAYGVVFTLIGDGHAVARELFVWPTIIALAFTYRQGYLRMLTAGGATFKIVIVAAAVFGLIGLFVPPFNSFDLHGYANKGWIQSRYGLNPYVHTIDQVAGWRNDPMFSDFWSLNPCPYGFLFARITKFVSLLGGGSLTLTIALFKALNLVAGAGVALLIWLSSRRIGLRRPDIAVYLFIWNPLLILHQGVHGHNDIVMALFLMLAFYLATADLWLIAIPALVAGILVKYVAAAAVPFAIILSIRRKGFAITLLACGLGALLFLAVGAPYIGELAHFQLGAIARNATTTVGSLAAALYYTYKFLAGLIPGFAATIPSAEFLFKIAVWIPVVALLVLQIVRFSALRRPSVHDFIAATVFAEIVIICIGSSKFYSWYIGMFFPVAMLLAEEHWLRELTIVISVVQLLQFTFIDHAHILNYVATVAAPALWVVMRHWPVVRAGIEGDWAPRRASAATAIVGAAPQQLSP